LLLSSPRFDGAKATTIQWNEHDRYSVSPSSDSDYKHSRSSIIFDKSYMIISTTILLGFWFPITQYMITNYTSRFFAINSSVSSLKNGEDTWQLRIQSKALKLFM
jgi:hypothetical protein